MLRAVRAAYGLRPRDSIFATATETLLRLLDVPL
jgi:hypothetical protein